MRMRKLPYALPTVRMHPPLNCTLHCVAPREALPHLDGAPTAVPRSLDRFLNVSSLYRLPPSKRGGLFAAGSHNVPIATRIGCTKVVP